MRPAAADWLGARPENFVLVSWTSHFYDFTRDIALDLPGIERLLEAPYPSPSDRREIDAPWRRLLRMWHLFGNSFPWLTELVASSELRVTLAEVHRYLENRDGIAVRIRQILHEALADAWAAGERVMLVGHSLGSVIAYDTLWEAGRGSAGNDRVDLLLTLGSPLATRFIRRSLLGAGLDGAGRYPRTIRRWINMTARNELVALHPRLEPFFRRMVELGLVESIEDEADLYNHFHGVNGLDLHKSYGYLNHPRVAARFADWIGEATVLDPSEGS